MENSSIKIVKGDTLELIYSVIDNESKSAFDLSDYSIELTAKKVIKSAQNDISCNGNIDEDIASKCRLALTSDMTNIAVGKYYYWVKINGNSKTYTIDKGIIEILE